MGRCRPIALACYGGVNRVGRPLRCSWGGETIGGDKRDDSRAPGRAGRDEEGGERAMSRGWRIICPALRPPPPPKPRDSGGGGGKAEGEEGGGVGPDLVRRWTGADPVGPSTGESHVRWNTAAGAAAARA
ncbi:hypothetical protein GCM10020229_38590 [Kitasatospora albolonga]